MSIMRCAARYCSSMKSTKEPETSVTFHRIPSNKEFRGAFLAALGYDEREVKPNAFICSLHFRPDQLITSLGRRKLVAGAVPSINLHTNGPQKSDESEDTMLSPVKLQGVSPAHASNVKASQNVFVLNPVQNKFVRKDSVQKTNQAVAQMNASSFPTSSVVTDGRNVSTSKDSIDYSKDPLKCEESVNETFTESEEKCNYSLVNGHAEEFAVGVVSVKSELINAKPVETDNTHIEIAEIYAKYYRDRGLRVRSPEYNMKSIKRLVHNCRFMQSKVRRKECTIKKLKATLEDLKKKVGNLNNNIDDLKLEMFTKKTRFGKLFSKKNT